MKTNESQILTRETGTSMEQMIQNAEYMVMQGEQDAREAESAEQEMRMKLEQALAARARREEAERGAKESSEKIQEAVA